MRRISPLSSRRPLLLASTLLLATALCGAIAAAPASAQVSVGQVDGFDTIGSTDFWERGANVDFALELTADGNGRTGKLVTFNVIQWSGDYLTAGVQAIRMDLENPGSQEPLFIRVALGDALNPGTPGSTWFSSLAAVELAPGQSATVTFDLDELALVRVQGTASHADVLGDVRALRILHNPEAAARGVNVIGFLRVDDITALGGATTAAPAAVAVPRLLPAYPNPFNPATTVSFSLPAAAPRVELVVTDLRGRLVRTLHAGGLPAGTHRVVWNGQDARGEAMASGVYLGTLRAGTTLQSQRLTLLK